MLYYLTEKLISLWPLFLVLGLILYFRSRKPGTNSAHTQKIKPRLLLDSPLHMNINATSLVIITVLVLTLLAIKQRILYDIARYIAPDNINYFDNLQIIVAHAMFIAPILIVAIIATIALSQKKEKYAVVFIPYFFTTLVLTLQLIMQVTIYFYNHHTKLQYYIIMPLIVIILSTAIYYIQSLYQKKIEEMKISKK